MDLQLSQLMEMQKSLYEQNKTHWNPREPENGRNHILYMIEEIGEMIAILKKKGDAAPMEDAAVRTAFLEELVDVMMYYTDVLLCFHVTPEEFSEAFVQKHEKNMTRNYQREYKELYNG